jgi:hypothetical protein
LRWQQEDVTHLTFLKDSGMYAVEGFEAKCGSRFLFDGPVGLFDDIAEVFALPSFDVCARFIVVSLER